MNALVDPPAADTDVVNVPYSAEAKLVGAVRRWPDGALAGIAAALCLAIFVIDLTLPLGVAGGVPYVAPVMLGVGSSRRRLVTSVAVAATLLTLIGWGLSPQGIDAQEYVVANRLIALFAIWATAAGVRIQIQTQQRLLSARETLRERENLAQLGEMAAVVAHEVKNPLAGISGVLQVLQSRFPEGSPDRGIIDQVLKRLNSLSVSVHELLAFARPQPLRRVETSARAMLEEVARQLAADPELNAVEVAIAGADLTLVADPAALGRAFLNLSMNSGQAMGGRGRLLITLEQRGAVGRVVFRDHGPGIPQAIRAAIFQPFYTTKIRGTGLGLAIVRQTVEAHDGQIYVLDDGPGASVALEIPLVEGVG